MKRFFSYLVVVVIALTFMSDAFCDEFHFSFRNGIEFGDGVEDVKSKEDTKPDTEKENFLFYPHLQLSSIGNSSINYNFENGKLYQIMIDYNSNYEGWDDTSSRTEEYKKINEGLIRKYGEPSVSDEEGANEFPLGAYYWYKNYYESGSSVSKELISFNQWIMTDKEYDVAIQHVLFEVNYRYCVHFLTYQKIASEESEMNKLNSIVDNDL